MSRARIATLVLVALPFVGGQVISAQTTGGISGNVRDETGGVLPGATIVVSNTETGTRRDTTADNDGRYHVTNLQIGQYEVSATLLGFQTQVRRGIGLTIGREATVDFSMSIGGLAEDVTVTGDAALVDTRSGSMGAIVDRDTILEIPLSGRDLTGLITLQAGTAAATSASKSFNAGYSNQFSIGGARIGDNSILLDGTEVKSWDGGVPAGVSGNFLGGEAIQEFKVEKNAFSAEFGGTMGGVINVVSKAGSNDFHGSVYGFTRNAAMDATNFRAPAIHDDAGNFIGQEKPDFWRAQYGASAGGRIIRNRTFYFANFEGMRERLGVAQFVATLTAAARQGILPGRTVQVNPAVVPYLDLWPLPADAVDLGDGTARYVDIQQVPTDEDFYQLRFDHNFSDADAIFGRLTKQISGRYSPAAISRWGANEEVYNTFLTAEHRKVFTSRLLNTVRFGFNRRGIKQFAAEEPGVDPALFLVPTDKWRFPLGADPMMGGLGVSGLSGVGRDAGWADRSTDRFQLVNSLVYTRGEHTWKLGGDWTYMKNAGDSPSRPAGALSFGSIDAFLRGQPRQFRGDILPETDSIRLFSWNTIGWYVQDDWQVHPRLSVNLGLRHDFYTVPTERDGKFANLKDPYNDTEVTVLGTRGDSWWENPSFKNFAPRAGVSWDPTGSGKTAVRAGAGLFHNLIQPLMLRQLGWRTAPFALESNIQAVEGVIPFPVGLYDYIVGLGAAQGEINVLPYDSTGNERMAQWNVNVQREILSNTAITLGYAGSRGYELQNLVNLNTAVADLVDGRYVFPPAAARPNRAFNLNLPSPQNVGASWYHGLQAELQRRFRAGWQMQLGYTWSKSIDLSSGLLNTYPGGGGGGSVYAYDHDLARGLSAFHVGHSFSASGVWRLPGGEGAGWADAVFGGWQLGGIFHLSTGLPFTASIGARAALGALGVAPQASSETPDLVPGMDNNPVTGDPDKYFDVTQFSFPPARTLGNLGRNTLIGPGLVSVDLGLTKNISVGTGTRVQARIEVFNLLNRANLELPSMQVFNGSGGRIANAGFIAGTATPARQVQLGLRLDW